MSGALGSSELLEAIRSRAGLEYLSDLHEERYRAFVYHAIAALPAQAFHQAAWQEAYAYILQESAIPAAPPRQALLERLR